MIDSTDVESIDKKYFETIEIKEYTIVIRSLSTGHYWCLLEQICNGCRTFQILHKHKEAEPYHPQKNRSSIVSCCEYIRSHDAFYQEKEKRKKERRLRRLGLIEGEELQEQPKKKKRERRVLQTKSGEKDRKSLDVKDIRMVK